MAKEALRLGPPGLAWGTEEPAGREPICLLYHSARQRRGWRAGLRRARATSQPSTVSYFLSISYSFFLSVFFSDDPDQLIYLALFRKHTSRSSYAHTHSHTPHTHSLSLSPLAGPSCLPLWPDGSSLFICYYTGIGRSRKQEGSP